MTLQFELTYAIGLVLAIIGAFWALGKLAIDQMEKRAKERHESINNQISRVETGIKADTEHWRRVEGEVMSLKADLPLRYVLRDDYVRNQSTIELKIDGLRLQIENAMLRRERE